MEMFNPGNLVKTVSCTEVLYQLSFIFASQSKRSFAAFQNVQGRAESSHCEDDFPCWWPLLSPLGVGMGAAGPSWSPTSKALITPQAASAMLVLLHASLWSLLQASSGTSSLFHRAWPSLAQDFLGLTDFGARQRALWQQAPWSPISDSQVWEAQYLFVYTVWWPLNLNQTE